MNRRRGLALVLVVIVLTSAGAAYFLLPPPSVDDVGDDFEIVPHRYNQLNWWDIAWDLGDAGDYLTPLTQTINTGNRYLYPTIEDDGTGYFLAAQNLMSNFDDLDIDLDYLGRYALLGRQEGYGTDNRAIVFGAHLDSDAGASRGVDQNAGGVAVVSMIATILSNFRLPIDVYYAFFSFNTYWETQENRAMYGSKDIARYLDENEVNVIAMYNFDEILYAHPAQAEEDRLVVEHHIEANLGYQKTRYLADLLVKFMQKSGQNIISADQNPYTQTDTWSFWDRDFPAVNVKSGHSISDIPPYQDNFGFSLFNHSQAQWLAKSAASVAVYLGLKGNGEKTSYKLERKLTPGQSATISTILTLSQTVTVRGTANNSFTAEVISGNGIIFPATLISESEFEFTTSAAERGGVTLTVSNTLENSTYLDIYLEYDSDTDDNSIPDSEQYSWPNPDPPLDWDNDGLSDELEVQAGTDVFVEDTDMDSVLDGYEVSVGMDPLRDDIEEDLDGDSLTNIREIALGTHPNKTDTDDDGLPDDWEVTFQTDPLVNDSQDDPDNDNLTNIEEFIYGADPLSADGDFDNIPDAEEVALGTDPLNEDSDNDGLRDQLELIEGLDPLIPDYDYDIAPDGSDPNPRISSIIVIGLLTIIPVGLGTLLFWRRIR